MTRKDLLDMLMANAKDYAPKCLDSIKKNSHMNRLKEDDPITQDQADAVIVDFLNYVAAQQCIDLAMYTKDLR